MRIAPLSDPLGMRNHCAGPISHVEQTGRNAGQLPGDAYTRGRWRAAPIPHIIRHVADMVLGVKNIVLDRSELFPPPVRVQIHQRKHKKHGNIACRVNAIIRRKLRPDVGKSDAVPSRS